MLASSNLKRSYRFGLFEADLASGELLRQGDRVRLQDLPFRLLTILLERAGEVVSREELRQRLWPADTYVEFDGSLNAALKRLRAALGDPAENPIFVETVPKRGYRFIAPVAVSDDQPEPLAAIAAVSAPPPPVAVQSIPERRSPGLPGKLVVYCAGFLIVLLVGGGWYLVRHRLHSSTVSFTTAPKPLPVRKSVAVLGFGNASGQTQDDWLGTAFAEMLSTELATGERLRLIPGEEVSSLRLSSPWSQTGTLGRETTARIGTALNSDVLVLGSYTVIGRAERGQLRLDVKLQDAHTGEVLTQIAQTAASDDLFRVTSEIGSRLRERLGIPGISDTEQAGVLASLPLNHDAARFYSLGIGKLREFDALAAKDLLEQAIAADPKFSLAHAMLARAWNQLGYEQKRKQETKKALDLSTDLPRTDRMQVEADYYESLPDHEKAASIYRALFELFPDSVDYGLQLAWAQNGAAHGNQAMETISRLRRLPSPASDDPRVDIMESRVTPDGHEKAVVLLHNAEQKASSQGMKLVFALARLHECMNLIYGEHPDQANAPCEDAYTIYRAAGNNLGAADAVRLLGDQQGSLGHLSRAISTYERALKLLQGRDEHLKTAVILNNMAICFTNEGNLDRGELLYRQAKLHFEQGGDKSNAAVALVNIADILYLRGNLPAAAKTYQQVIEISASVDNGEPGYALYRLADLRLAQGQVQEAHSLALQALESLRPKKSAVHGALSELGDVLKAEGDLQGARQQYQAALEIQQAKNWANNVAESQAALSEVALDEGHPDQAEKTLRTAIAEFEKEKVDPDVASAYTSLSRALLMEGKLDDARMALRHASDASRTSPDPALKLPLAIQRARIEAGAAQDATAGPSLKARQQLRSVIASARKMGYYEIECEARLALAELEMKTNSSLGPSLARNLAAEASNHNLQLISRQAKELIAGSSELAVASDRK